eukprot:g8366.t1
MDGDQPAAMRYTEVRLLAATACLLDDYEKGTVDFVPNYDDTLLVPSVLPARFPNLLINGASGIAVGMATNIPPHNLGEVLDACIALVDNPALSVEEIIEKYVPAPDFPTGGLIMGKKGVYDAYRKGRGSVIMRGRAHVETLRKDREAIIITEIPYQVNKSRLVERIAELVQQKELEGISDLRDESDRNGVRIVIELKRDTSPDVLLSRMYAMTPLQTSFGANMLAIHRGRPVQMGLKEILEAFLEFREEVITRRTGFYLNKARDRAHLVIGLLIAVANIDEVIALIRSSQDPAEARQALMERKWSMSALKPYLERLELVDPQFKDVAGEYTLSEEQARGILDLRLHRLTGLEQTKLVEELEELMDKVRECAQILRSRSVLLDLLKKELLEVRQKYATPRRSTIEAYDGLTDPEALIEREDMVVTFSVKGYIKRVPLDAYRSQHRGGRGRSAMSTREEDILSEVFVANTHVPILFFSSAGRAYALKVYALPLGTPQGRGRPLVQVLPSIEQGETVATILPVPENPEDWEGLSIIFATSTGHVRRNALSDFQNIRANGKIAIKLTDEGERLISVQTCHDDQDILLTTRWGRSIRFAVTDVRTFVGRTSTGVRGIRLGDGDEVVAMTILDQTHFSPEEREVYLREIARQRRAEGADVGEDIDEPSLLAQGESLPEQVFASMKEREQFILTVSEKGFGKRTSAYAYRRSNRGGQGVAAMEINQRTGKLLKAMPIGEADDIILLTNEGQLIRCPVNQIRLAGRKTQGVILFRIGSKERVVSVVHVDDPVDDMIEDETPSE